MPTAHRFCDEIFALRRVNPSTQYQPFCGSGTTSEELAFIMSANRGRTSEMTFLYPSRRTYVVSIVIQLGSKLKTVQVKLTNLMLGPPEANHAVGCASC